jgi:hypothetical protein
LAIKEKISECLPHPNPLKRPDYTEAEIQSLRAVHDGSANKRQQRMALDFLMRAFGTHDISFRPGDPHETSFCEGKRWCGTLIVWMLKAAPTKTDPDKIAIRKIDKEQADDRT